MIKQTVLTCALLVTMAIAGTAHAGSSTGTLTITATVDSGCLISSTKDIAFGKYDPLVPTNTTADGEVGITCVGAATDVNVELDEGLYKSPASTAAVPKRRLSNGTGGFIEYDILRNYAYPWGVGAGNRWEAGHFNGGPEVKQAANGVIPAGQSVPGGTYSDTVTATVNF